MTCGLARGGPNCDLRFEEITPTDREGSVTALNQDGTVAAGDWGAGLSFTWTRSGGTVPLPLPGTSAVEFSHIKDITADGLLLVGTYMSGDNFGGRQTYHAFRANSSGLSTLTTADPSTIADVSPFAEVAGMGISSSGSVIVGHFVPNGGNTQHAFTWTQTSRVMVELPGGELTTSDASNVSGDGRVAVGSIDNPPSAVRWILSGPTMQNVNVPTGYEQSVAEALSADGTITYGTVTGTIGSAAFRTTSNGQTAFVSGKAVTTVQVIGCSGDGNIAVGVDGMGSTWIWDQSSAKLSYLAPVLNSFGANLNGAALTARAISTDGNIIGGTSTRAGVTRGFIARWR